MVKNHADYKLYKEKARALVYERIEFFNRIFVFKFNRVSIRNQKTRWGSCSKQGNLNFNYKLALLPQYLVDYVIVHELCHLKEMNHSKRFWNLVGLAIPNYLDLKKQLNQASLRLR